MLSQCSWMLWVSSKRREEGLKDMVGARPQEVHGQVGGILFRLCTTAPTAA